MKPTLTLQRIVIDSNEKILLRHPFDRDIYGTLMKSNLGYWDKEHRGWILTNNPQIVENLQRLFNGHVSVIFRSTDLAPASKPPTLSPLGEDKKHILEKFTDVMEEHRYSENTIKSYYDCISLFFRFFSDRMVDSLTSEDLTTFNRDYILRYNYSSSFQNQVINAVKLFYQIHHGHSMQVDQLERPIREKKLPVVLSLKEVEGLLNSIRNLKHRTMIMLIYSCGLRRSELLNICVRDIDSDRMMIHIKGAKGKKDRMVPLSETMLKQLRSYAKAYRPKHLLFVGHTGGKYSASSLQNVFKAAVRASKIRKPVTLHTLRHSYATHLLESGINLRYIQEVLGHNSPKTTQIYTHVSSEDYKQIISPLEKLKIYEPKIEYISS